MSKADMILFQNSGGTGTVQTLISHAEVKPSVNVQQGVTWKTTNIDINLIEFEVKRPLNTGSQENFVIPLDESFPMIWARNEQTSELIMHTEASDFEIKVPKMGGCAEVMEKEGEETDKLFRHGLIMWCSWFVIGVVMICTNRWYMHVSNINGYLHAILGWAVLGCNAFAAIDVTI